MLLHSILRDTYFYLTKRKTAGIGTAFHATVQGFRTQQCHEQAVLRNSYLLQRQRAVRRRFRRCSALCL